MNPIRAVISRTLFCTASPFNRYPCQHFLYYHLPSYRTLYTKQSLRLDAFIARRENSKFVIQDKDEFKSRILESIVADEKNLLFATDLKKMILITETDEDIELLHKMIKRYCQQNDVIRFHSFTYGPELMRVHYVLNKPIEAMALLEDMETTDLFNQIVSYLLVLDMLYENSMYQDVVKMFHLISQKQMEGRKYPFVLINIFMAACYKMNTPESYQEALSLWKKCKELGLRTHYRSSFFLAMLAYNQNNNVVSIEILSIERSSLGKNILMRALAKEKRFSDVLELLKMLLYEKDPKFTQNRFVTIDTINKLEEEFQNSEDGGKNFKKMKEQLIAHKFVTDEPLENFLCQEIEYQVNREGKQKRFLI